MNVDGLRLGEFRNTLVVIEMDIIGILVLLVVVVLMSWLIAKAEDKDI